MSPEKTAIERALELIEASRVVSVEISDGLIWGTVLSSDGVPYTPFVTRGSGGVCGCVAYTMGHGACKHIMSLLLSITHHQLMEWIARGD